MASCVLYICEMDPFLLTFSVQVSISNKLLNNINFEHILQQCSKLKFPGWFIYIYIYV